MIDLSSQYDSSLDRDAEDQQEQDSEDERLSDRVVRFYASLSPSQLGEDFFEVVQRCLSLST